MNWPISLLVRFIQADFFYPRPWLWTFWETVPIQDFPGKKSLETSRCLMGLFSLLLSPARQLQVQSAGDVTANGSGKGPPVSKSLSVSPVIFSSVCSLQIRRSKGWIGFLIYSLYSLCQWLHCLIICQKHCELWHKWRWVASFGCSRQENLRSVKN